MDVDKHVFILYYRIRIYRERGKKCVYGVAYE